MVKTAVDRTLAPIEVVTNKMDMEAALMQTFSTMIIEEKAS